MSQTNEALLQSIRQKSKIIRDGNPPTYQIPLTQTYASGGIEKYEYGMESEVDEKIIMLVGPTGSGKTTLVNSIINYLFGVEFDTTLRLQLIAEPPNSNQAMSLTQTITAYTIHKEQFSKVPYTLTIIDTPGFGDTGGYAKDEKIMGLVRTFFTSPGGIDHIDAIGFVAQSSLPRLTPTQKYIFDKVLSIFGKDIEENVMMLLTFADENEPRVLSGIREAKFHYSDAFKFNNSVMFEQKPTTNDRMSRRKTASNQLTYEMGEDSFEEFAKALTKYKSKSLTLTKEVLNERKQLEDQIKFVQNQIQLGVGKLDELNAEVNAISKIEGEIEQNKGFEIKSTKVVNEKQTKSYNSYNCSNCEKTCKRDASSFYEGVVTVFSKVYLAPRKCDICFCERSNHEVGEYEWVAVAKEVVKTLDDIKRKYQDGLQGKLTKEKLVAKMENEVAECRHKTIESIKFVQKIKARLDEIALKPNPLSSSDYIDLLISAEKNTADKGYKQRIDELEKIKKDSELLHNVTSAKDLSQLIKF